MSCILRDVKISAYLLIFMLWLPFARADVYEVVDAGTANSTRSTVWLSEGPLYLTSSEGTKTGGNRFRFGGEVQFARDYRWLVGITALDYFSSGESSSGVLGGISRESLDFDLGYFLVPDRLWVKCSLVLGNVSAANILGPVGTTGQGLSLGYRFYNRGRFNVGAELSYVYFPAESAGYYDPTTQGFATAPYPAANILSLNLRFGLDFGGI